MFTCVIVKVLLLSTREGIKTQPLNLFHIHVEIWIMLRKLWIRNCFANKSDIPIICMIMQRSKLKYVSAIQELLSFHRAIFLLGLLSVLGYLSFAFICRSGFAKWMESIGWSCIFRFVAYLFANWLNLAHSVLVNCRMKTLSYFWWSRVEILFAVNWGWTQTGWEENCKSNSILCGYKCKVQYISIF